MKRRKLKLEKRPLKKAADVVQTMGTEHSNPLLPSMLGVAVLLRIMEYQQLDDAGRKAELDALNRLEPNFCMQMEFVLHRGPKEGDSAKAFNNLARCIALLSFAPGGVTVFGSHWDASKLPLGRTT